MTKQKYLLLDFGASHGRCIVAEYDGNTFTMETVHDFDNVPATFGGTLYWDTLRLVSDAKAGIKKAFRKHPEIVSIGVDSWGCDYGYIDKAGKLVANPVNYRDATRYIYKKKLDGWFGEYEIFRLGGANTNSIMGLYGLYAHKEEDAFELKVADRLLMEADIFNYWLTGVPTNEYTLSTMMLMVDQKNKVWEKQLFDKLELPYHIVKDLTMPGTPISKMQAGLAEELGIPRVPVIAVAAHDTASAMAGVPATAASKNWAYVSLGTWAIYGVEGDSIYSDRKTFELGFANQGGCEGKTNLVDLFTGLWVIQECYRRWKDEADGNLSWNDVVAACEKAEWGKSFIDLDAEAFAHPHPNMPERIRQYLNERGEPAPNGMGEVARCVYESLALALKYRNAAMERITGVKTDVLHCVGGGANNALLCQWLADALGITVMAGPAETTSVGNLIMQMKGLNAINSIKEGRELAARSSSVREYTPQDTQKWNSWFDAYLKAAGKTL